MFYVMMHCFGSWTGVKDVHAVLTRLGTEAKGHQKFEVALPSPVVLSSNNKNIKDLYGVITEFKKDLQSSINLAKDKRGDLLADSQSMSKSWKNC
jgi:hypothetical protein